MRFWLDMGVDALRMDAIPYLVERDGTSCENLPETHRIVKRIRAAIDAEYANRLILAEANEAPADVRPYFGDGDECHMAFHFPLMPRIYTPRLRQEAFGICFSNTEIQNGNSQGEAPMKNSVNMLQQQPQRQSAQEIIAANVKALIEQLEQGRSETLTAHLSAMSRFHRYSFGNILSIARHRPDSVGWGPSSSGGPKSPEK